MVLGVGKGLWGTAGNSWLAVHGAPNGAVGVAGGEQQICLSAASNEEQKGIPLVQRQNDNSVRQPQGRKKPASLCTPHMQGPGRYFSFFPCDGTSSLLIHTPLTWVFEKMLSPPPPPSLYPCRITTPLMRDRHLLPNALSDGSIAPTPLLLALWILYRAL